MPSARLLNYSAARVAPVLRGVTVRRGRRADARGFLRLLTSLAVFEKLEPPTQPARRRILGDIFVSRRLRLLLAVHGGRPVGYALYYFTYSSFLAKPTLYLEDLFVDAKHRGLGVGGVLLARCAKEAVAAGCGRMEWSVLNWNTKAARFYEELGARRLSDWSVYRMDSAAISELARRPSGP